jgi:hypothetical protein
MASLQAFLMPWGLKWAFFLAAPVFVAVFFAIGWLFNRFGLNLVQRFINEAIVWERAGKTFQAEKLFRKAVAVFDSFLISPVNKEKRARVLTGHMARFYLTQTTIKPEAENAIKAYLKMRPEDHAVAEAWLQHLETNHQDPKELEGLLSSIGTAQSDEPAIQTLIVRHCLANGRTDFQALQSYRRFIQNDNIQDESMTLRMAELFFEKRRVDALALQAYATAYKLDRQRRHLIHGIAACAYGTQVNSTDSEAVKEARALLSKIDEPTLKKIVARFKPAAPPVETPAISPKTSGAKTLATSLLWGIRTSISAITSAAKISTAKSTAAYRRIRRHPELKAILGWTAMGMAGAGLAILVINTASYLIQSRPPKSENIETPSPVVITDPYTLQVAAYLKVEHAEKYVAQLKHLGLDAYWTKAKGAKSEWYQVRLSHFADKASARAYGDNLKAKGIIDDYYVANYQHP